MPHGAGVERVRNRAFAQLAEALDLPGGIDSLEEIDLDHVSPVLPLRDMAATGAGTPILYRVTASISAGMTVATTLSFWDATSWTNIFTSSAAAGATVPPQDWPVVINRVNAVRGGTDIDNVKIQLDSALGTKGQLTFFAADQWFDSRGLALLLGGGTSVISARLIPTPIVVWRSQFDQIVMQTENTGGAGSEDINYSFDCFTCPPGLIRPY